MNHNNQAWHQRVGQGDCNGLRNQISDAPDVTYVEMTGFTDQVDLTCKRHVGIEDETQVNSEPMCWLE